MDVTAIWARVRSFTVKNQNAILPILMSSAVLAIAGLVAASGTVVTSGGNDQRHFHLPAVIQIVTTFPDVDFASLPTATGPLYHLAVAVISGPLSFGEAGMQVVGAVFGALLAGLAIWHSRAITSGYLRMLAVAPLLLSGYFWQSTVWMLTDDAALLFAMAAVLGLLEGKLTVRREIAIGLLIACAVATRQTFVWLLVPACLEPLQGASASRFASTARLVGPGVVVLTGLVVVWGGLTPPSARAYNASGLSAVGVSFVFAVAVTFAVPILAAVDARDVLRDRGWASFGVGLVLALPAMVWASAPTAYPDSARRGGVLWSLAAQAPVIAGHSALLAVFAFIGGFTSSLLYFVIQGHAARVLSSSVLGLAAVTVGGAQLFPRYAELPLAMIAVLVIVILARRDLIQRKWPLLVLAIYQATIATAIVGIPIARALS